MLKIIAAGRPQLLKDWQSRQQKMADVGVSNLHYADASLAVAAGILPLTEGGLFQLSRPGQRRRSDRRGQPGSSGSTASPQ